MGRSSWPRRPLTARRPVQLELEPELVCRDIFCRVMEQHVVVVEGVTVALSLDPRGRRNSRHWSDRSLGSVGAVGAARARACERDRGLETGL